MKTRSYKAAVLAVVIACLAPSPALAQTEDPGLSEDPPVELNGGSNNGSENGGTSNAGGNLAETGSEPLLIGLAGLGLLLAGAGLRLRLPAHGRV